MRYLRAAAILITAAAVLLWAFARHLRRGSMFFPDRFPAGSWDVSNLPVQPEDHVFPSTDGVRLHSWLFRAADPAAPLMLFCHGNGGNLGERAPIAAELARRGMSVLLFDWRGYGKSEGTPTESGLYRDAEAAYQFARTLASDPRNIVVYGESLGGPYAADIARTHRVRCVIIENSFPSLNELGNALYAPLPVGWTAPMAMRTTHWLNEAGVPVLVMHGKCDQTIPFALGQRLYDGLRVPKEMLVSETAGHCELAAAERDRYYDTVMRFVGAAR